MKRKTNQNSIDLVKKLILLSFTVIFWVFKLLLETNIFNFKFYCRTKQFFDSSNFNIENIHKFQTMKQIPWRMKMIPTCNSVEISGQHRKHEYIWKIT